MNKQQSNPDNIEAFKGPDSKDKKILVVDDDRSITAMLEFILREEGYLTKSASNAQETLQAVSEEFYNVAVVDYKLPDKDGITLAKEIKEINGDTEVIILTGKASLESAIKAVREDIYAYIPKTSDHGKLIDTIKGALEKQHLIFKNREYLWNLRKQKIELERLNKFKDGLISMISHDLRSPICSIKGFSQSLLEGFLGELNEKQKDVINTQNEIVDAMMELINNLLDMRQLQVGKLKMEMREINLTEAVINSTVKRLTPQINEKNLNVTVHADKNLPNVTADAARVSQVLQNLLQNAIKFTAQNEGVIEVTAEKDENGFIKVKVKDNGKGISPDSLNNIFEAFYTSGSDESGNSPSGRGLGLAICKEIIRAHNGEIWAESEGEGKGSAFIFTLPLAK